VIRLEFISHSESLICFTRLIRSKSSIRLFILLWLNILWIFLLRLYYFKSLSESTNYHRLIKLQFFLSQLYISHHYFILRPNRFHNTCQIPLSLKFSHPSIWLLNWTPSKLILEFFRDSKVNLVVLNLNTFKSISLLLVDSPLLLVNNLQLRSILLNRLIRWIFVKSRVSWTLSLT
jgi:hypothetical protein